MNIRILCTDDAEAFQSLRLRGLQECPTAFSSSFEEEHDRAIALVAGRIAPTPGSLVLGAFESGDRESARADGTVRIPDRLVGVTGLARERQMKLAHKALIWGVYVAPEFRKRGIGRLLLNAALDRAASMPGLLMVNLGVNARNVPAISLYESAGFAPFGIERGYMFVGGELHDEVHMSRPIGKG